MAAIIILRLCSYEHYITFYIYDGMICYTLGNASETREDLYTASLLSELVDFWELFKSGVYFGVSLV